MDRTRDYATKPAEQEAIDWLAPNTPQHMFVLQHLRDRIKFSNDKMSKFYARWRQNELALQAYISLPDYEAMLKQTQEDKSGPAVAVSINVPLAWSTVNTIVTYLIHMFAGRSPMFSVGSLRAEQVKSARNMEQLLQYNVDYQKFVKNLYFFLMDGETYGVSIMRTMWTQQKKSRWIITPPSQDMIMMMQGTGMTPAPTRTQQPYISFEGNTIDNVDPFMFFPDPRVPMSEVATKGEFVFWRAFEGKHILLKEQALGRVKHIKHIGDQFGTADMQNGSNDSHRAMRALGDAQPGNTLDTNSSVGKFAQLDQGTIEIIPKDLGLSDSTNPEKWLFTIANGRQIIQAQRVQLQDDAHPIVVAESNSVGYSFGQLSTVDMLRPMQDMMSWFLNSHIYNVRAALNNMLVVDPTRVEMSDLKRPEPGKLIRLKNTMMPSFNNQAPVTQLAVNDVTRGHLNDFSLFSRLASDLNGATDNNRGLQSDSSRKTATEVRTAADAGTSHLAAKGKLYSAMSLTGMAEKWAINFQANLSQDFELSILGQDGVANTVRINPDTISGDFYYPVHDGTLPFDKVGLLDVWQKIFLGILQDQGSPTSPPLRAQYDVASMFAFIAKLGGAQNINEFQIKQQPTSDAMNAIATGQGIPLAQLAQGGMMQ